MIKVAICQCGSLGTPEENMANMVRLFKKAVGCSPNEYRTTN